MTRPPSLPHLDVARLGPRVGSVFPDVALLNQHGELVDLHHRRGRSAALVVLFRSTDW